ncbi:MAG: Ig-like domain-containing protein [Marmoricola sp.]
MTTNSHRLRVAAVAAALFAPLAVLAPAAHADAPLGAVTVNPTTAKASNATVQLETHGACPAPSTAVKADLQGPGITDNNSNNLVGNTQLSITTPNGFGGFNLSVQNTMKDVLLNYGVVSPSGDYTIEVICQDNTGTTVYGMYTGMVHIAHVSGDGVADGTYSSISSATTTSTVLSTGTPDPIKSGTATSLTGTVTPSDAVGSIQFKRGTTNIGSPIAVSGGTATLDSTVLPAGTNSLTAVFTPTDANAFKASTSAAKSYVVAGPASITGTAKVGSTITCSSATTSGATKAYVWTVGTATSSVTTSAVKVSYTWASKSVKCTVKTTKNAVTVSQTSAAKTIAKGTFSVTSSPKVTGTASVGHTLTCSHGTWSPTPSSYKYQWYRGSTALSGKTASTYKTSSSDKGKYVTCSVTVAKTGYTTAVKKAVARKIS